MIETVIKRNGEYEEFKASKLNQWGEWAAKTLGTRVDWTSVVLDAVSTLPKVCSTQELQKRLIKVCLDQDTWSYNRMAGRLYAAMIYKDLYDGEIPTVKALHDQLAGIGIMIRLDYTDDEYEHVERIINHKLDLKSSYYELHQLLSKYSLSNRVTGKHYESQQFVYMRMAMALAEDQPKDRRMTDVEKWYEHLSQKRINAPTPNFVNLGTHLRGYASCCLVEAGDTAKSIAATNWIANTMTYMSAGIGTLMGTRSIGDPVRGGAIEHQGKLPYYRALMGEIKANLQSGRGGACTVYIPVYDPEIETILRLKNPMSTEDKRIRGLDYNFGYNKFFVKKVAKNEDIFLFNCYTAPDLHDAFYSDDEERFETLYKQYDNDPTFKKTYVNARDIALIGINESFETARVYEHNVHEMNRHTPFKDTVRMSNLCVEVVLPTAPYQSMEDLVSTEDHGRGEIALCSLGGIVIANVEDDTQ